MKRDIWLFVDGGARHIVKGQPDKGFHGAYASEAYVTMDGQLVRFAKNGGFVPNTTTPRMEFTAVSEGLKNVGLSLSLKDVRDKYGLFEPGTIYIVCDAMNTVKTMTDWVHKWIAITAKALKDFLAARSEEEKDEIHLLRKDQGKLVPVANQDVISLVLKALDLFVVQGFTIKFVHVNSHVSSDKMEKAYMDFQKFNNIMVGPADFKRIIECNESVDNAVDEYYKKGVVDND